MNATRSRLGRRISAGLTVVVAVSMLTLNSQASAAPPAPPSSSPIGVTGDSNGWTYYTTASAASLGLTNVHSTTISGTKDASGACVYIASSSSDVGGQPTYEETTAENPQICQETVMIGNPSEAAVQAETQRSSTAAGSRNSASSNSPARARVSAVPNTTFHTQAYMKSSWIDPLKITITSFAVDMNWYYTGSTVSSAAVSEHSYKFAWDNWYGGTLPPIAINFGGGNASTTEAITYYNDDFAAFIRATMGVAGWAACGFTTHTAVFHHQETVHGNKNGSQSGSTADSKSGACSNLVHRSQWNGYGYIT